MLRVQVSKNLEQKQATELVIESKKQEAERMYRNYRILVDTCEPNDVDYARFYDRMIHWLSVLKEIPGKKDL